MANPVFLASLLFLALLGISGQGEAKTLKLCDAVHSLEQARISRSMISSWICMMQSESGMDTRRVTGSGVRSTSSYGVFQINSDKWCKQGRLGGKCMKRCEDLAKDDITDAIVCAKKIVFEEGLKHWNGWNKNCRHKRIDQLPNIGHCW